MINEDMKHLIPSGLDNKADVLFGNLEQICQFHRDEFLKDLEACNFNIELVALCFTKRVSGLKHCRAVSNVQSLVLSG